MIRVLILFAFLLPLFSCARKPPERGHGAGAEAGAGRPSILVIAVAEEPDQLVPAFARSPASGAIWPWILPSLVRIATDSTGRGRFVGDIAVSWQSEDGGRAWRFFLGAGRLWEDTTAVGPADVIESYRLYRDPILGGGWGKRLEEILSVESPQDGRGTILFRYRRPVARARALELATLPLISTEQWTKTRDRSPLLGEPGRPVHAAGPFRIEEWKAGEFMRLARHPFAPPDRTPRAERILLRFVPAGRSRALELEQGVADCAIDLPGDEAARLRDEGSGVVLRRAGPVDLEVLAWNLDHPLWGGWPLRRAASRALDVERIRRAASAGQEEPTGQASEGFLAIPPTPPHAIAAAMTEASPAPIVAALPDTRAASGPPDGSAVPASSESTAAPAPPDTSAVPSARAARGISSPPPAAVRSDTGATPLAGPAPDTISTRAELAAFGPPSLELLYSATDARRERQAVEVALELDRLGVSCRLLPRSENECRERIAGRRFEAVLMEFHLPALTDLGEVWGTGGAMNVSGLSDASVDSLIAFARSAAADTVPDVWNRVENSARAALPCLVIERRVRIDGLGPRARGYRPDPTQPYGDLLEIERREDPVRRQRRGG